MPDTIGYRLSETRDREKIKNLLRLAELPVDDIDGGTIDFVLATDEKQEPIGCIGLEQYGIDGLLRSFAVDSAYRDKGIGHELLFRLLAFSRQSGVNDLHLLTTTAEKFFDRAGFSLLPRNEAPDSIKSTSEFSSLCPSSSAYMVMKDIQKKEAYFSKDLQILRNDKESGAAYWAIRGENMQFTYFEVPPDTIFPAHKHESEQITRVLEGELFFEIENNIYSLSGGDTIIIPSEKLHRAWTNSQSAKAIDAWAPVNEKYGSINPLERNLQTIKQKV